MPSHFSQVKDVTGSHMLTGGGVPLGQLPAFHALHRPLQPMVTVEDRTVTHGEMEARANRRARALQALGVEEGDFVTVLLPNTIEHFETTYAIWKLGATPNVVSWRLTDIELREILDLVRPKVVVGCDPARAPGWKVLPETWTPDSALSAEALPEKLSKYWKAMTSGGSTGRPKVIVDHMPAKWDPTVAISKQPVGGTVVNPGPLYHNAPFTNVHLALAAGNHAVNLSKFDPVRTLQMIALHKANWVYMVPTMMNRIWRLPAEQRNSYDLSSLDTVMHMAAPCPVWLKEMWINWLGPEKIWELYAGTEGQGVTMLDGTQWLGHRGSVGRVQPGSRLQIINEQGEKCAPGEIGEIYFLPNCGRQSTYHYLGAEAKNLGQWESLGDLGHLDEDGYLYLADRRTDLIISGGINVYPAEIESAIEAHPDVESSVAIGMPDDDMGQIVHAIVHRRPGSERGLGVADLMKHLEGRIASYKLPRSVEFVDTPVRDDTGKVRRSAFRQARLARQQSASEARTGTRSGGPLMEPIHEAAKGQGGAADLIAMEE